MEIDYRTVAHRQPDLTHRGLPADLPPMQNEPDQDATDGKTAHILREAARLREEAKKKGKPNNDSDSSVTA